MDELVKSIEIGQNVSTSPPVVSIIIPCYNTAEFVAETLDSVFAQTFTHYEVVLVNDGSPDSAELRAAIRPYLDRLIFIDKEANSGCGDSRNIGAKHARGRFFVFLDSDDVWCPEYLEAVFRFLNEGNFDMVYTAAESFGMPLWASGDNQIYNPGEGEITRAMYIAGKCFALPSGAFMRADAFREVGGFDPGIFATEDFHLFMRLLFAGKQIGYLKRNLFKYRVRVGSYTGNAVDRLRHYRDVWPSLMKVLPFTDDEIRTIEMHIAGADAAILRAEGRLAVLKKDWPGARRKFRGALATSFVAHLPWGHRLRMFAICCMLLLFPRAVYHATVNLRQNELPHMPNAS